MRSVAHAFCTSFVFTGFGMAAALIGTAFYVAHGGHAMAWIQHNWLPFAWAHLVPPVLRAVHAGWISSKT